MPENKFITFFDNEKIILLLIIIIALSIRLIGLDQRELWYDEILTIQQSKFDLLQIIKDVPTPIHYLFVKFFSYFSTHINFLILGSIFFNLLSIYYLNLIVNSFDKNISVLCCLLFSISPMMIEFSKQVLFFSYFIFFSLYHVHACILLSKNLISKVNWIRFLISLIILPLTIMTSFPVIISTIIFIIFQIVKKLKYKEKLLLIFFLFFILSLITFYLFKNSQYSAWIIGSVINSESKDVFLGYSLSHLLASQTINNLFLFYASMFKWFGFGTYYELPILLSFFCIGFYYSFIKDKFVTLLFISLFIFSFFLLFAFKIDHWFEEKYFIYLIPFYLIFISSGIYYFSSLLKLNLLYKNIYYFLILFFLIYLSINGYMKTTSFGYTFDGHTQFSFNKAIKKLEEDFGAKYIFVRNTDYMFASLYNKKSQIIPDGDFIKYSKLLSSDKYFFLSIPDLKDLSLGRIVNFDQISKAGGFNLYKLNSLVTDNKKNYHIINFNDYYFISRFKNINAKYTYSINPKVNHIKTSLLLHQSLIFENNSDASFEIDTQSECFNINFDTFLNDGEFSFLPSSNIVINEQIISHRFNTTNYLLNVCNTSENSGFINIKFNNSNPFKNGYLFLIHQSIDSKDDSKNLFNHNLLKKFNYDYLNYIKENDYWILNHEGHLVPACIVSGNILDENPYNELYRYNENINKITLELPFNPSFEFILIELISETINNKNTIIVNENKIIIDHKKKELLIRQDGKVNTISFFSSCQNPMKVNKISYQ